MIFEPNEDDFVPSSALTVQANLRELLYRYTDYLLSVMRSAEDGEEVSPSMLNVIRTFLKDQGVDYQDALAEGKARALMTTLSDLPDFAYFKSRFAKPEDDSGNAPA